MGNVVQTGPILAGPIPSRPIPSGPDSPTHALDEARPKVLVSLSTIYYQGQREALGSLITALSGMNVDAIVTTGDSVDPNRLPRAGNVEVCRRVSHDQVMPTVSLVICHGGHGTTMKALAHGVPVLIMPLSVHLDHRMIGEMVVGAGAGRMIRKTDTPQQPRQVIEATLNDARLKTKAARLGAILRSEPGAAGAAARLRALRAGAAGTSAA
jgi:UDP:flavonoid glycosyltransferase YjiC (YdhE family)